MVEVLCLNQLMVLSLLLSLNIIVNFLNENN